MKDFFDQDGPLFTFLARICDLIVLNVLLCLSFVTVVLSGACLASCYKVLLKLVWQEKCKPESEFVRSIRGNIVPCFPATLLLMLDVTLLLIAQRCLFMEQLPFHPAVWMLLGICATILTAILSWLFPLLGRYENTFPRHLKNALLLMLRNPKTTILMLCVNLLPLICVTAFPEKLHMFLGFWILIGFAGGKHVNADALKRVFEKIDGESEKAALRHEAQEPDEED